MGSKNSKYSAESVAVVIPTKDRPESVRELLDTLASQSCPPGHVVVVASGLDIQDVVMSFSSRLNVEYKHSDPGQIRQRNLGIACVREESRLVAFLDDKIILEPDAMEEMICCWNRLPENTGGVGFNIVNGQANEYSWRYGMLLYDSPFPGRVLKSGCNITFFNIAEDTDVEWLGGGYTVWRKKVLDEFPQEELKTKWAVGEDLRYSYPIGKKYPLWACAKAEVHNKVILDQTTSEDVLFYRNRMWALAVLYFARTEPNMRLLACVWMILGVVVVDLAYGFFLSNPRQIETAHGRFTGLCQFLKAFISGKNLKKLLED